MVRKGKFTDSPYFIAKSIIEFSMSIFQYMKMNIQNYTIKLYDHFNYLFALEIFNNPMYKPSI